MADFASARAERLSIRARLAINLTAFGLLAGSVAVSWWSFDTERFLFLKGLAVATFVSLGKFVVLLPVWGEGMGFSPFFLAGMVTLMDIVTAMVVVANIEVLYRLRWIGAKLLRLETSGRHMLKQRPWIRRLAVFGVVLFVMFPLTGTGAVGGTIFGRLIGLRFPRILFGIALGAVLGSFGLALGADALGEALGEARETLWFRLLGLGVVAFFIGTLVWQFLRTDSGDDKAKALPTEPME